MVQASERRLSMTAPWLWDARHDVAYFFAPALLAICATMLFKQNVVINSPFLLFLILQGFALGPFHQGLTLFQFFDQANLREYKSSHNVFWAFCAPVLLIAVSIVAYWYSPPAVLFVYVVWTIQHIAKQNIGVLLLYHNHDRNEAIVPREIESRSIETSAALFSFLYLNAVVAQTGWVAMAVHLLIAFLSAELIWLGVRFFRSLWRQVNEENKSLNAPGLCLWLISCLAFLPFAMTKDYAQGLFVALVIHWFQYIGINSLLLRRKYVGRPAQLAVLSKRPELLLFAVGILFVLVMMPVQASTIGGINQNNWLLRLLVGMVYGMTLSHYCLDAYIWRFREPFNRAAILRFLKPTQCFSISSKTSAATSFNCETSDTLSPVASVVTST
ncbi:MAG TPA: hypothetical protein V6C89_17810 [Drouetiella sp.]|jgi:hypothetical protein